MELQARIEPLDIRDRALLAQRRMAQHVLELLARDCYRVDPEADPTEIQSVFDSENDVLVDRQRRTLITPGHRCATGQLKSILLLE